MGDDSVRRARSTVLRLRGLPFQATEADIEHFFEGYRLTQCSICKRNGRSTGEAYVQLESEALAGKALHELNCKYVGRRYIEIFEAMESDIVCHTSSEMKSVMGFVLRLRGLPYAATRTDVDSFFEGLEICKGDEGIVFSVTSLGKPTGEAYVEFVSEESQQEAMKKHKQHMGSRYIELFKSTKADLLQALQQNMFYKEQAQKRQLLSRTVVGLPSSMGNQQRLRIPGYNFPPVDDVSDVLKGLSVRDRCSLMLSPTAPPFQTQAAYDRLQNFRVPPSQQYMQHQPGFISPQYYMPEPGLDTTGSSGRLYSRGQMYDMQNQQRGLQHTMMHHPSVLMRQQPYMMRPHVVQQPHQMVMRYPTQGAWIPEQQPDPLAHVNSPTASSFTPQYSNSLRGGFVSSPSGPIEATFPSTTYTTPLMPNRSLPDVFEADEPFNFAGQSTAPMQRRA